MYQTLELWRNSYCILSSRSHRSSPALSSLLGLADCFSDLWPAFCCSETRGAAVSVALWEKCPPKHPACGFIFPLNQPGQEGETLKSQSLNSATLDSVVLHSTGSNVTSEILFCFSLSDEGAHLIVLSPAAIQVPGHDCWRAGRKSHQIKLSKSGNCQQ